MLVESFRPGVLEKLLQSTGSVLDARGNALYAQLVASPTHAQGALHMMAAWDLSRGRDKLRQLRCPVRLLVGGKDATVPPVQAKQAMELLHHGELTEWPAYGHLVHEEAPAATLLYCRKQLSLE